MLTTERIPNNVNLSDNKRLQRALEHWQPKYDAWWRDMGPAGFQDQHRIYLRTAVSVDPDGWAHYDYVRMPEYRWGIFLAAPEPDRRIGFGDFQGQPVWQDVPGEFRNPLRRLVVTQGDTEPASVEQQRVLGSFCPSLYDLRNLFQVNVEEGRHLWAMAYILHSLLRPRRARRGRGAARAAERERGQAAHPRRVQRADRELARLLHVRDVHRSRREVAADVAVRERVRSAVAHDALHADGGVVPHVRGRERHLPHPRAHLPADEGRPAIPTTCGSSGASTCRRSRSS